MQIYYGLCRASYIERRRGGCSVQLLDPTKTDLSDWGVPPYTYIAPRSMAMAYHAFHQVLGNFRLQPYLLQSYNRKLSDERQGSLYTYVEIKRKGMCQKELYNSYKRSP